MAKTKALISCAATAQLICGFVFAYEKIRFSHVTAHTVDVMLIFLNLDAIIYTQLYFVELEVLTRLRPETAKTSFLMWLMYSLGGNFINDS